MAQGLNDVSWILYRRIEWQRQMNTKYGELSEKEKESDRHQADKIIKMLKEIE